MSIRKIVDLPFVGADDALLPDSLIEVSYPVSRDALGQFKSKSIHCSDFKSFALNEVQYKNDFPNGIHISSCLSVDGQVQINTNPTTSSRAKIPYSRDYYTQVDIRSRSTLKLESPTTVELSCNEVRFYVGKSGTVDIQTDSGTLPSQIKVEKQSTGSDLTIACETTFSVSPEIVDSPYSILDSDETTMLNVNSIWPAAQKMYDELIADRKFGRLAYYDYEVVDSLPTAKNIKSNCFYFVTQNIY